MEMLEPWGSSAWTRHEIVVTQAAGCAASVLYLKIEKLEQQLVSANDSIRMLTSQVDSLQRSRKRPLSTHPYLPDTTAAPAAVVRPTRAARPSKSLRPSSLSQEEIDAMDPADKILFEIFGTKPPSVD